MHAAAACYRIIRQQTLDCKTYSTVCFEIRNIFFARRCMRIENFVVKAFSMIAAGTNRFRFSRFQKPSVAIILKLGETTREKQRSATRIPNHIADCNLQQKIPEKLSRKQFLFISLSVERFLTEVVGHVASCWSYFCTIESFAGNCAQVDGFWAKPAIDPSMCFIACLRSRKCIHFSDHGLGLLCGGACRVSVSGDCQIHTLFTLETNKDQKILD